MAERAPVEVTVEIEGQDLVAGTLWIHDRGGQTASFRYADSYLTSPGSYALDPVLPKAAGVFHTPPGSAVFSAFADSAPDRWGENLMRREERERARAAAVTPRSLGKADFLLGVRDDTRQGAIRFRQPGDGSYYSAHRNAVPRLIEVARLLRAVERLDAEGTFDRDIEDLIDAGSSLGGARPKAAITNTSGRLAIAKFPRSGSDEWDAPAWEEVQLRLAGGLGCPSPSQNCCPSPDDTSYWWTGLTGHLLDPHREHRRPPAQPCLSARAHRLGAVPGLRPEPESGQSEQAEHRYRRR